MWRDWCRISLADTRYISQGHICTLYIPVTFCRLLQHMTTCYICEPMETCVVQSVSMLFTNDGSGLC